MPHGRCPTATRLPARARPAALALLAVAPVLAAAPPADRNHNLGETLTAVTTAAFARHPGLDVLSSADLRAVIALEADRQKLGCDEADGACLAEVAGALGARHIVIGQLGGLERTLLLGLTLYDVQAGRALGRELVRASDLEALVAQIEPAVQRLVALLPAAAPGTTVRARVLVLDLRVTSGVLVSTGEQASTPAPATTAVGTPPAPAPVLPMAAPPQRRVLPLGGLGEALACLQRAVPRAVQSEARYASWVDLAAGPSCQERHVSYGLYAPYDDARERCTAAVPATAAWPEVQKALGALATAVEALWPPLTEASAYYQGEDYLDDGCARGRALHPALVQGFAALHHATEQLVPALDRELERALARPAPDDSPRRRSLGALAAALHAVARQAPLWGGSAWEPGPALLAAHEGVLERWREVQAQPAPTDPTQAALWRAALLSTEPVLTELKRRVRGYRDLTGWRQRQRADAPVGYDPEELRGPLHGLLLDLDRLTLLD